jgi:hypothetical protein
VNINNLVKLVEAMQAGGVSFRKIQHGQETEYVWERPGENEDHAVTIRSLQYYAKSGNFLLANTRDKTTGNISRSPISFDDPVYDQLLDFIAQDGINVDHLRKQPESDYTDSRMRQGEDGRTF